jgi:hypothetical protein
LRKPNFRCWPLGWTRSKSKERGRWW